MRIHSYYVLMDDPNITYEPVVSSNISEIGYDVVHRRLFVKFNSGQTWAYDPVEPDVYQRLKAAPSKGVFFWREIRAYGADNRYQATRVR